MEKIIAATAGQAEKGALFNNAAQIWNHTFYWQSLTPKGGGQPPAALKQKMEADFGSVDACKKELPEPPFHSSEAAGPGLLWTAADSRS